MAVARTLPISKPHAVARNLTGALYSRFEPADICGCSR